MFNYENLENVKNVCDNNGVFYIGFAEYIGNLACEYYHDMLYGAEKFNDFAKKIIYQNQCTDCNTLLLRIDLDDDIYMIYNFETHFNCIIQNGIAEIMENTYGGIENYYNMIDFLNAHVMK